MARKPKKDAEPETVNTLQDKLDFLNNYIKTKTKELGDNVVIGMADDIDLTYKFMIPPIPALASLLSDGEGKPGGFPYGKITVIAGPEKSGKTTLCIQTLAYEMQQNPENIYVWVDTENSFDTQYAKILGLDFSRLIFIKNGIMHDVLNRLIELSKSKMISGIIVDSVGGLTPKEELENSKGEELGVEKDHMLNLQRKLGQFFRMINPFVARSNIPLVMIAHVYQDPGMNGAYRVKGGNALKHWGHIRLMISRENDIATKQKVVMPDGEVREIFIGHNTIIKLDKTRQNSKEGQSVVLPYRYGIGIDSFESTISVAINLGIIERAGAWYKYKEEKYQGRTGLSKALKNKEIYDKLLEEITVYYETTKSEIKDNESDYIDSTDESMEVEL